MRACVREVRAAAAAAAVCGVVSTLAAAAQPVPLFPPGRLLVLSVHDADGGTLVQRVPRHNFGHLSISEGMLENHALEAYRSILRRLAVGGGGGVGATPSCSLFTEAE